MDEVKLNKDDEKYIRTLSQYLEKFHLTTGYQNKEVAELLNMDKSYYNKIRLKKFSPISNSISILKKFASLNDNDLISFISEIEELNIDKNFFSLDGNDWEFTLKKVFLQCGPLIRKILIEDRLKPIIEENETSIEKLIKCFIILSLVLDISKNEKWLNSIMEFVLNIHHNIEEEQINDINELLNKMKKMQ
ncbi:hypothetical protein ACWNT8_07350 [Pigmentibacter ruber]|uniref:hypothetical protein n=1 Tax=Pigmentibacter ruber TaxID=2683196 RepID=UPI00131B07FB|nr:hypothetical protein [Pigmentibacter ruber]BFD32916.1 hypothetical protein GTC16762_25340 [Pigmentibacter ruber]